MLFKVGEEIIDTDKVPVALIFKNVYEAEVVSNIIGQIKNGDTTHPIEEGGLSNGRWWFMTPASYSRDEQDSWSVLTIEQKKLLETSAHIQKSPEHQF